MDTALQHYHGDKVRQLFIAGAIVMAAFLPFYSEYISEPVLLSITAILVVSVSAGLTSPKRPLTSLLDMFISAGAVVVFERYAVAVYKAGMGLSLFFVVNQAPALIFLCALYFATKTVRESHRQA